MRKYLTINLLCIMLVVFLAGCFGSKTEPAVKQPVNDTNLSELENLLDKYSKQQNFSGTVLIVDNGMTLVEKGYSMADYDKKINNDPNTIFRIGSITKQFTAMCILILEERGLLKTTDSLDKYIPGYPNGDKITIHNLLTHTSGIAEYVTADNVSSADHYFSPMEIINSFKDKPLEFEPDSKYQYCNSNYILLGNIIEKVSGKKYEDFVKENIFTPLGMGSTDYDHNDSSSDKAVGYDYADGSFKKADYFDMSFAYSAGALQSTIGDLYKWDQALFTEKLVKKETLSKMFTPYKYNYAYGWVIASPDIMYHNGSVAGFSTIIYRDIKLKRVIVILANEFRYNVGELLNDIVSILNSNQ